MEAAVEAARLRFRPIVMTSLAFMLGVAPLAVSTGAGSAARKSMGTGVFGGMLLSTFVATIFVPMFFTLVARRRQSRLEAEAGAPAHSASVTDQAARESLPPDVR
jgi:multidrug efflux pump subunit AcrB